MLFFYITNLFIFYFILHGVKVNRWTLEATGLLETRRSALEDDFEEEEEKEEEDQTLAGLDSLALDKDHLRGRSSPRERDRDAKK